ncbi:helix-turn-helix domain-containing protein [Halogeometricum sp. S1BR25-6]|uniref:Helix-turn-helix domain-containing protein n=1 Tax=Halogeometricum salsisoli TaxID=2950536 RepID=A0ABU2G9Q2_9EURY|nr:helix-turn-helix domain-containing protein [Halogeometricum sp. S1BR25-6]MDS0297186.1 helix-turn-helix domain-containing protein [Halogeometricum sp. S1BR25-6]
MRLELSVPVGGLGLVRSNGLPPTVAVEFERTAFGVEAPSLVVVSGDGARSAAAEFRASPVLEEAVRVGETDGEAIYWLSWTETLPQLLACLRETGGTLLRAELRDREWRLTLRFSDRGAMSHFHTAYDDPEHPLTIHRVGASDPTPSTGGNGVTETQRGVLRCAWEGGYFEVPQQLSLAELAEEMDISETAASRALRRGTATLLDAYLRGSDGATPSKRPL